MIASENYKVIAVLRTYVQVIESVYGRKTLARPPLEGKHFDNCIKFYDSARDFGATLQSLVLACLDYYPPWWCTNIFGTPYPNAMIIVSEKSRNQGLKCFPATAKGKPDKLAEFYAGQLKTLDPEVAQDLLRSGFPADDATRKQVEELMKKEDFA